MYLVTSKKHGKLCISKSKKFSARPRKDLKTCLVRIWEVAWIENISASLKRIKNNKDNSLKM